MLPEKITLLARQIEELEQEIKKLTDHKEHLERHICFLKELEKSIKLIYKKD
jgi:prefoldin subunit 5